MNKPAAPDEQGSSTRPYLIRALHDWCTDNGFTPYIAVYVNPGVQVPMEYVKNNEIVLNIGFEATSGMKLGNQFIEFRARFGGVSRDIVVPVDHVVAIYARENGQGMAFPVPPPAGTATAQEAAVDTGVHSRGGLRLATPADEADAAAGGVAAGPTGLAAAPASAGERSRAASVADQGADGAVGSDEPPDAPPSPPAGGRPALKRVK